LVAALLPTPGGLGVAEAGITSLSLRLFKDMTKSTAAVSTLIVRLATLWFGVALGLLMFAVLTRRLARRGIRIDQAQPSDPAPVVAET
ncbi:MAG TPA: lysylphosphatidylglycerol synthase domain-containing protein, partial [Dehalococcoidia bacterium]